MPKLDLATNRYLEMENENIMGTKEYELKKAKEHSNLSLGDRLQGVLHGTIKSTSQVDDTLSNNYPLGSHKQILQDIAKSHLRENQTLKQGIDILKTAINPNDYLKTAKKATTNKNETSLPNEFDDITPNELDDITPNAWKPEKQKEYYEFYTDMEKAKLAKIRMQTKKLRVDTMIKCRLHSDSMLNAFIAGQDFYKRKTPISVKIILCLIPFSVFAQAFMN